MLCRRWLIVGLCFCAFTGCVSCQSNYDYCGPMPDQGGDFMYRKNSILGGDPAMPQTDGQSDEQGDRAGESESGPEPTPAPLPDEAPTPGVDLDDTMLDEGPEMRPDGASRPQSYDEEADEEELEDGDEAEAEDGVVEENPVSTLEWHTPTARETPPPVRQARFR